MAFTSELHLAPSTGTQKKFVRTKNDINDALWRDAVRSPSIPENTLRMRTTEKGSLRDPSTYRATHNTNRVMTVMVDGKPYTASVNLTVSFPGGNVITDETLKAMVGEVLCLVTGFSANSTAVAPMTQSENISTGWTDAVLNLQTE